MRQRAIDLLYAMCDHSNAEAIVAELLTYLEKADYSIRERLVRGWEYMTGDMDQEMFFFLLHFTHIYI